MSNQYEKFKELTYEKFRELASDATLSQFEKIGFPDSYRKEYEEAIFEDIVNKLTNLKLKNQLIMDIGPGCSNLAMMLIEFCKKEQHHLILIDSKEMLSHLPDDACITKIAGRYPNDCEFLFERYQQKINAILCYSVLHYIYVESNLFDFIDRSLTLLASQGQFLIGDIPNISKRKRFFSSPAGIAYHQQYTNSQSIPEVIFNNIEAGNIDDAVLTSLLLRSRSSGYDAYIIPQGENLPMANRREDLLITKP